MNLNNRLEIMWQTALSLPAWQAASHVSSLPVVQTYIFSTKHPESAELNCRLISVLGANRMHLD